MLIEPASKVSVPLPVVIRTRSNVPDKVFDPPKVVPLGTADPVVPEAAQVVPLSKLIIANPEKMFDAAVWLYTVK